MSKASTLPLEKLLTSEAYEELKGWWSTTAPRMRARARWAFDEPAFCPPRRPAKSEAADADDADADHSADVALAAEFHARLYSTSTQHFFGTPQRLDANLDVWVNAMGNSHVSLLDRQALTLIAGWAPGATVRQREAFNDVLWSLQDFRTSRKATTTSLAYPWKVNSNAGTVAPIIDPFYSSLGRPSSAPIAPEVHLKLEREKLRDIRDKAIAAEAAIQKAGAGGGGGSGRDRSAVTFASTIPMKWAMLNSALETTAQEAACAVPRAIADGYPPAVEKKSASSCPPASGGCGRLIGGAEWHGDARYDEIRATALKSYPASSYRTHKA